MIIPPLIPRLLRPLAVALVVAVPVTYLGLRVHQEWHQFAAHRWAVNPGLAVLSLMLASGWFLLRARLCQLVMRTFGGKFSFGLAFRIFSLAELGRYVPGKVWYVAGRPYLVNRAGVRPMVGFASMVVELALMMISALVFSALPLLSSAHLRSHYGIALGLIVVAAGLAVHPRILSAGLNLGLRFLGKEEISLSLGFGEILRLMILCAVSWTCMGLAFFAFVKCLYPEGQVNFFALAGAYTLAWTLGTATVVSPAGFGVREAILAGILGTIISSPAALVIAIGSRIWITLTELICTGMGFLITAAKSKRGIPHVIPPR